MISSGSCSGYDCVDRLEGTADGAGLGVAMVAVRWSLPFYVVCTTPSLFYRSEPRVCPDERCMSVDWLVFRKIARMVEVGLG